MSKTDHDISFSIIYDLTIEERGLNANDRDEHQAIMRLIHITSGRAGKGGAELCEFLAFLDEMCESDYKNLKIYSELKKIVRKHQKLNQPGSSLTSEHHE